MKRSDLRRVEINLPSSTNWCGYFHRWYVDLYSAVHAIIEKEDGSIVNVEYSVVKFLPDPNQPFLMQHTDGMVLYSRPNKI